MSKNKQHLNILCELPDMEKLFIADAGARYGMHPMFRPLQTDFEYYGFDPDAQEINRLKKKYEKKIVLIFFLSRLVKQIKKSLFILQSTQALIRF